MKSVSTAKVAKKQLWIEKELFKLSKKMVIASDNRSFALRNRHAGRLTTAKGIKIKLSAPAKLFSEKFAKFCFMVYLCGGEAHLSF